MNQNNALESKTKNPSWTTFLCNITDKKCNTAPEYENIVSELTSAFILCLTVLIGVSFNGAAIYKLLKQDWRKCFTLIQLQATALIFCGLLAPIQITRICLSFTNYDYSGLCNFHHFVHLHAEMCSFLSMITLAYEKWMKIFMKSNEVLDLTLRKLILISSWTLILPFVTYIINEDGKDPTAISAFTNDCINDYNKNKEQSNLIELINMYVFAGTSFVVCALYLLCVLKLVTENRSQSCRVGQDPSIFCTSHAITPNCRLNQQDLRHHGSTLMNQQSAHSSKMVPSAVISGKSATKTIPSVEILDISDKKSQNNTANKKNNVIVHKVQVLQADERPTNHPIRNEQETKMEEMSHETDLIKTEQSSSQDKTSHFSSTKDSPISGVTSSSPKDTSNGFQKNSNSHLSEDVCSTVKRLSLVSDATGSSSTKETCSSDKTVGNSVQESKTFEKNYFVNIGTDKKHKTLDNSTVNQITNENRKKSEAAFSQSEEKNSYVSTHALISDTDNDSINLLNPLRHTRMSPGHVFHNIIPNQTINSNTSPPTITSKSMNKKRKMHKNKILKRQPSTDSIGAFSTSSHHSDISTLGESDISSCYKFHARSIDSFLDDGLANILEQPEPEHQENKSLLKQGTCSHLVDNLEIPEMRLRSNTGNLQLKKTLPPVEEDEFRQRAQSDLTEDKQKKRIEEKKYRSLKNRKLSSKFLRSSSSILSGSTDSSLSDINIDKELISKDKLITHNQLHEENSINLKLDRSEKFLTKGKQGNNCKLLDSASQTDEDLYQNEENGKHKTEYPTIRIIRPSVPDTATPPSLRRTKNLSVKNIPAIIEDIDEQTTLPIQQENRLLSLPSSPSSTVSFQPPSSRSLRTARSLRNYQHSYSVQDVTKCSLLIVVSFILFYLPMFIVVHTLDKVSHYTALHLLLVARSLQYTYYCILPIINAYTEDRM